MNANQIKRYNELFEATKEVGRVTLPDGTVSYKLSDIKKVDQEFRISGPSCNGAISCGECSSFSICWD
jgi:hypothetical protein